LEYGGKSLEFVNLARHREIEIAISEAILEEFTGVLRDKFHWSELRLQQMQRHVRSFTTLVEPKIKLSVVESDHDDDAIVECAVESGSEAIITNDGDLLRMKEYQGIEMLKVGAFLNRVQGRGV